MSSRALEDGLHENLLFEEVPPPVPQRLRPPLEFVPRRLRRWVDRMPVHEQRLGVVPMIDVGELRFLETELDLLNNPRVIEWINAKKLRPEELSGFRYTSLDRLGIDVKVFREENLRYFDDRYLEQDPYDVRRERLKLLIQSGRLTIPEDAPLAIAYYKGDHEATEEIQRRRKKLPEESIALDKALHPYRRRAYSEFIVFAFNEYWHIHAVKPTPYSQKVENFDIRRLPRQFAPIDQEMQKESRLFHRWLAAHAELYAQVHPDAGTGAMLMGVHQIVTEAWPGSPGDPSPEGAHQDGDPYLIGNTVVLKENVKGGGSTVLLRIGNEDVPVWQRTLGENMILGHRDTGSVFFHDADIVEIKDPSLGKGRRAILGVGISPYQS